jgi:hypothetical protein
MNKQTRKNTWSHWSVVAGRCGCQKLVPATTPSKADTSSPKVASLDDAVPTRSVDHFTGKQDLNWSETGKSTGFEQVSL